ncbi:hypothetical protein [Mycoplana rhizolycopersici]|uniref:hypothetical protein n=1 Tax=Mycoplana rhizolycopersici TaxID=2746702 RepID=UPI001FE86DB8|nr:hypothetical protein [Rhizobium rhizolycopersici]
MRYRQHSRDEEEDEMAALAQRTMRPEFGEEHRPIVQGPIIQAPVIQADIIVAIAHGH